MKKPPKPKWHELPAKFINPGRKGVLGIVLHDTDGNGSHSDTLYLANPDDGRKVSSDFTVERDGSIWKLNPDLRQYFTNHAGRATRWRNYLNSKVNTVTVGIEITQNSNLSLSPLYPQLQIQAVAGLCAWLSSEFEMAASDITTHRQIITDGSRSDPKKFPFDDENGFWHYYWAAFGLEENYLASLKPGSPETPSDT